MPEGYVAWAVSLFVLTTLLWAAVWWWLPALFRDRDRKPPTRSGPQNRASEPAQRDRAQEPEDDRRPTKPRS